MKYEQKSFKPVNLPIEFKEINTEDFSSAFEIKGKSKLVITPDKDGFIWQELRGAIELEEKNTVIVNAGVGQGKSTSCINIAVEYLNYENNNDNTEYIVLFIAPFISIINKYQEKLIERGVHPQEISNYQNLQADNVNELAKASIHIITINTLLGDYGEDAFFQSRLKRDYITGIIKYASKQRKKVVFIFDEAHDYIQSFKPRFIINLWKWEPLIHKAFILSATFTESSKVVLKYIAELTDFKVQIIESKRVKVPNKQSNLHLILYDEFIYSADDEFLSSLIENEIKKDKHIHILSFSEKLAAKIAEPKKNGNELVYSKIGKILMNKYGEINLCTSKTDNKFHEELCNVGTTFKTGISIDGSNTSYFIIAPHASAYQDKFTKKLGIFSQGMVAVVQAVARVRSGENNDIIVIMPTPKSLIKGASRVSKTKDYLRYVSKIPQLWSLKKQGLMSEYFSLNEQNKILDKYYSSVQGFAKEGIDNFNVRYAMSSQKRDFFLPRIDFPTKDEVVLMDGDRLLTNSYDIFGANTSSYFLWAAWNNQFENCTLSSIYHAKKYVIKEGEVIAGILNIYYNELGEPKNFDEITEKEFFDMFFVRLSEELEVSVQRKGKAREKARNSTLLRKGLISVVQYLKKNNEASTKLIYPHGKTNAEGMLRNPIDAFIDKYTYINGAIANSFSILPKYLEHLNGSEKELVQSYIKLGRLVSDISKCIVFVGRNDKRYILRKEAYLKNNIISNDLFNDLFDTINKIVKLDFLIRNNTISFCQWAKSTTMEKYHSDSNTKKRVDGWLLDEIREIWFETKETSISKNTVLSNVSKIQVIGIEKVYSIESERRPESYGHVVNLVY